MMMMMVMVVVEMMMMMKAKKKKYFSKVRYTRVTAQTQDIFLAKTNSTNREVRNMHRLASVNIWFCENSFGTHVNLFFNLFLLPF